VVFSRLVISAGQVKVSWNRGNNELNSTSRHLRVVVLTVLGHFASVAVILHEIETGKWSDQSTSSRMVVARMLVEGGLMTSI